LSRKLDECKPLLEGVNVTRVPGKPGDGRGVVATARLARGARVLRIPASLTLSPISARNLRVQGGGCQI